MKAHVWVMPKRTVLDPQGQTIQHALSGLGYAAVKDVRQGKFFVLNLDGWNRDEAQKQLERISKEVLTNPSSKNTASKSSTELAPLGSFPRATTCRARLCPSIKPCFHEM